MASTVDDVTSFYKTWYVPSNAVLTVAGDFDSAELKGDIKLAQGDTKAAHAAYQQAMLSLVAGEPRQTLLQMKLDQVAVADEG